ncbi:unnamed protein product [Rotaria socialis]|uniref:Uncharacterized protein n=1 Tax=Rotaria socialis TaxID=392032 RepID=A0A820WDN1_9BILA|nr:unnamed protein product [Rotaria socialis]CAF4516360.1 unnamed protein product [Rotaria socialis]
MKFRFVVFLFLLAIDGSATKRQCLSDCTVSGLMGMPLVVPDGLCKTARGTNCEVTVRVRYHQKSYSVTFDTSYVKSYSRFIYILPSYYLSYTATYSCSSDDSCALSFAKTKVLDLSNRTYDFISIVSELRPLLEERRQAGDNLNCYDGTCLTGLCEIEYDTKSNSLRKRVCNREASIVRVSAFDSGSYATLDIECNRTNCNSPNTMAQVKRILHAYNLTDANGRINRAQNGIGSAFMIGGLMLFSYLINKTVL